MNGSKVALADLLHIVAVTKAPMNTLLAANLACLGQGVHFLENLDPALYGRSCPELFNSSIGGHFRHNMDHYLAFMDGFAAGSVDYDARERSQQVEEDPAFAAAALKKIISCLEGLSGEDLERSMMVRMDDGGDSIWSSTTLLRELQFLLSHTIHHYALVVSIATRFGQNEFPEGFGLAPSTLHYHSRKVD